MINVTSMSVMFSSSSKLYQIKCSQETCDIIKSKLSNSIEWTYDSDSSILSRPDPSLQQSNTTITHYSPISSNNSIEDFIVGSPVYITGDVYKLDRQTNKFIKSTVNDTTDCICSVKTISFWKEFIGICTSIDKINNCITFATHGDYLVKVDDSSCYSIGDEVFVDNEDNKLKILVGATAITSKIRRTTIGIVTGLIDNKTLAVFKA